MLVFVDIPIADRVAFATVSEAKAWEMFVGLDIPTAGKGTITTGSDAKARKSM